jgi:hypothetical protein
MHTSQEPASIPLFGPQPLETAATTLYAARGRLIPFNSNSPTGSTFTAFSTFVSTRGLIVGDHFSRVDLTVASLLAGFARPKEMPVYHGITLPDALAADIERWRTRPAMRWVTEQYRSVPSREEAYRTV